MTSSVHLPSLPSRRPIPRKLLLAATVITAAAAVGITASSLLDDGPDRVIDVVISSPDPLQIQPLHPAEAAFLAGDAQEAVEPSESSVPVLSVCVAGTPC